MYRYVFAHICYVLQDHARTDMYFKRTANSVNNGHGKLNMVSNCSEKDKEYPRRKDVLENYSSFGRYERKRSKMRVLRDFYEMLKMA